MRRARASERDVRSCLLGAHACPWPVTSTDCSFGRLSHARGRCVRFSVLSLCLTVCACVVSVGVSFPRLFRGRIRVCASPCSKTKLTNNLRHLKRDKLRRLACMNRSQNVCCDRCVCRRVVEEEACLSVSFAGSLGRAIEAGSW